MTNYVLDALDKVRSDFGKTDPNEQAALCAGISVFGGAILTKHAATAFNFHLFTFGSLQAGNLNNLAEGCPRSCPDSIGFLGSCYHAQVVNYLLWGVVNQLCGVSLAWTKLKMRAWKAWNYGQFLPERQGSVDLMIEAGYNNMDRGSLSGALMLNNLRRHDPERACEVCRSPVTGSLPQPALKWSPVLLAEKTVPFPKTRTPGLCSTVTVCMCSECGGKH